MSAYANETDRKLDELLEMHKSLGNQIAQSRQISGFGHAKETVNSYSGAAKAAPFTHPFRNIGHFFKSVHDVGMSHRPWEDHAQMKEYIHKGTEHYQKSAPAGMNELMVQDGAVLVPPQFVQQILQRAYDNDIMQRTTLMPTSSAVLKIPAVNEISRANGSRFGGVQAFWRGEGQTVDNTKPGLMEIELKVDSLTLLVRATNELLNDAGPALQTFIQSVASQELAFKIGAAIIGPTGAGTGNGMPLGILQSPCLITQAAESGQAARTLNTQNITKMWSRMWLGCRNNAVWFVNQDVEPQLLTMTLGVGTGGVVTYMPAGGLSASPYATLMGRPVITTEFNPTLGTAGDILLADMSQYITATRGGMETAVSMYTYFTSNEQLFRFIIRLDGRPWWISPLTPYQGTVTKSPFVCLATRA